MSEQPRYKQGDKVYVKVGKDWIPGKYYDELATCHRIEVEQIYKGRRRYKVKGSETIWPYSYRYAVKVKDVRELKPRPESVRVENVKQESLL